MDKNLVKALIPVYDALVEETDNKELIIMGIIASYSILRVLANLDEVEK